MTHPDPRATPTGPEPERGRPTSLSRQLMAIGLVVVVLVGLMVVTRLRFRSGAPEAGSGNALNPNQVQISRAAAEAVELRVARVQREPGARTIRTTGTIHFSPYSTINVSPRLVGRVRAVFVKVGDMVSRGEPLAEMQSSDAANAVDTARDADAQLKLTRAVLDTARRQFTLGTPEVTAAEATLAQARENTRFTRHMLQLTREQSAIGGFTDRPLTDAQSAARQADTQLAQDLKDQTLARKQFERIGKLFAIGIAARADVDTAENTLGKANDAVDNDREQARIAHQTADREQKAYNTRLYANQNLRQAETSTQQALLQEQAAVTALRMARAALTHDLKQAEHDYEAASADAHAAHTVLAAYDRPTPEGVIVVRAPAAGVVTARNVNPGQMVDQTGETPWQMFTLVNAGTVSLDTQVYEKEMMGVRVGQRVRATSDAWPARFTATGVICYVAPGLDPNTHALSVRAELDNRSGLLKEGLFVNVQLDLGPVSPFASTPIVPLTAVVHDGDSDYLFIAVGGGRYDRRKVTLGEQRGEGQVAVTSGLKGDESIVVHGALSLGAGGTAAD